MSNKKLNRRSFIIGLLFIIILCFPTSFTKVSSQEDTLYFKGNEFSIHWIHSVEKEEWQEFYRRDGQELILTYTKFKTFGAGVPSQGEIIKREPGFVTYEIGRKMNEINLIVSDNVKSTLYIENRKIPLYSFVDDYEEVTIKQAIRPFLVIWFGKKI